MQFLFPATPFSTIKFTMQCRMAWFSFPSSNIYHFHKTMSTLCFGEEKTDSKLFGKDHFSVFSSIFIFHPAFVLSAFKQNTTWNTLLVHTALDAEKMPLFKNCFYNIVLYACWILYTFLCIITMFWSLHLLYQCVLLCAIVPVRFSFSVFIYQCQIVHLFFPMLHILSFSDILISIKCGSPF